MCVLWNVYYNCNTGFIKFMFACYYFLIGCVWFVNVLVPLFVVTLREFGVWGWLLCVVPDLCYYRIGFCYVF